MNGLVSVIDWYGIVGEIAMVDSFRRPLRLCIFQGSLRFRPALRFPQLPFPFLKMGKSIYPKEGDGAVVLRAVV